MTEQQLVHICAVCGEPGQIETTRVLPDHAIMKRAIHTDQEHEWTEYDSIDNIGTANNTLFLKPRDKVLEDCPICHKLGYKYKTHFQHSNEPPIGPRILKGKQEGWRYRRCIFAGTRRVEKHPKQRTKIKIKTKIITEKNKRNILFSETTLIARDLFIKLANHDVKERDPNARPYIHAALQRKR